MPIDITIVGSEELQAKFDHATPALIGQLRIALAGLQYELQGSIRQQLSGALLKNRTGDLRNSFAPGPITESGGSISAIVGSNSPYARIQNVGGTISAKSAQNLTIPLDEVLTGNGAARYSARTIISNPGAGGFTGTFFHNGILFGKRGKEIVPLFALKPSVTLRASHYIEAALEQLRPKAESAITQAVEKTFNE